MLLMPSALIGQDQSLDIGALASALADQRARIIQLQEELDQTAALLELTRRLEGLTPCLLYTSDAADE